MGIQESSMITRSRWPHVLSFLKDITLPTSMPRFSLERANNAKARAFKISLPTCAVLICYNILFGTAPATHRQVGPAGEPHRQKNDRRSGVTPDSLPFAARNEFVKKQEFRAVILLSSN